MSPSGLRQTATSVMVVPQVAHSVALIWFCAWQIGHNLNDSAKECPRTSNPDNRIIADRATTVVGSIAGVWQAMDPAAQLSAEADQALINQRKRHFQLGLSIAFTLHDIGTSLVHEILVAEHLAGFIQLLL